jgi:hypothetical protein
VTDPTSEDTERRVRGAMHRLADGHRPDADGHWPASHPNATAGGPRSASPRNRWLLVAASLVVVVAGLAALAVVQLGDDDPTNLAPVPSVVEDPDDDPTPTTVAPEPTNSVATSVPVEELGGVRFPVDAADEGHDWIVPWADGFLAGSTIEPTEEGELWSVQARFTTDGERWEPVEMTLPPGMTGYGRIAAVGDRFVMADFVEVPDDADAEKIRVASTTDLINWTTQDFDLPGPLARSDQNDFGASFPSMRSFAVNEAGWVFEVVRIYSGDATAALPTDVQSDLVQGQYSIASDENGFVISVYDEGGSPATPESTYAYTWAEVGITPDRVPYMIGEIPASQTWAATWDGVPTVSETLVPTGQMLASQEGFVRWNDQTWFSPDGLTWTASPLPDPTGTVHDVVAIDGGFLAIVANQESTWDLYRLDERGADARVIEIEGLPERFAAGFNALPTVGADAVVIDAGVTGVAPAPLVIDLDGYRYVERSRLVSVVDLATGETVLSGSGLGGAPAADTWFAFRGEGITITDPTTGALLIQVPIEVYQAAQDARRAVSELMTDDDEYVSELVLLAVGDGERFLVEPLRSNTATSDDSLPVVDGAVNGDIVLLRIDDEWVRYELP